MVLGLIRLVLWYGILPPPILQPSHYLSVVTVQLGYCNVRFGKFVTFKLFSKNMTLPLYLFI